MFTFRQTCASAALVALAALPAQQSSAQCLSFAETLELSASRDPGVEAARAERREATANLKEAQSLARPQVSGFGRTGLGDIGAVNSVVQNQFGIRASQRIYDFGDARFAREAARSRELAGVENTRQEQLYAAQESGASYLDYLEADAQLHATKARRDYFVALLDSVDTLLEKGGATRSERADVAARLADAEAASLELRFLKAQAETEISIDTGTDLALCEVASADAVLDPAAEMFSSMDQAVEAALFNSPLVKALELRARSQDATRRREKRARLPVVEVVGVAAYSSNSSNGDYDFQERIGIDISIPFYTGSSLDARYERAKARDALAGAEAASARRKLREQTSITFQRILSLRGQLESRRTVEAHKQLEVSAAMMEFDRGVRTLRDLIETRLDYEDATLERIRTEYELKRRKLELITFTAHLPVSPDSHETDQSLSRNRRGSSLSISAGNADGRE